MANPPNVVAAVFTAAVLQGVAIYKARQAGTWPAPRTELGIVVVGVIIMVSTRLVPQAKWFGVIVVLAAIGGVGTTPQASNATTQQTGTTTAGGRG